MMKKVTWVGVGVMGYSMAGHLAKNGYEVSAYNRSPEKARKLQDEHGAKFCETVAVAVAEADVIFTMVGYPKDVEEVYLGGDGIFANAKKGAITVDMTTSSPALAARLYEEGKKRGIRVMDAPVSGGDLGARNATLSIMVGGDEKDFEEVKPLFDVMGKNILLLGPAGFGQHTKMSNQIALAGIVASMTEAIVYARKVGLDPQRMLEAIGSGAAGSWQTTNMAPRVLREDFAPGFFIKHYIKDMKIAKEEIEARGLSLEVLDTVLSLYGNMADLGWENDGTQALIKRYTK